MDALSVFRREVETGVFPAPEHTYQIDDDVSCKVVQQLRKLIRHSGATDACGANMCPGTEL